MGVQVILASIGAQGDLLEGQPSARSHSGYMEEWQSFSAYKTNEIESSHFTKQNGNYFSKVDLIPYSTTPLQVSLCYDKITYFLIVGLNTEV